MDNSCNNGNRIGMRMNGSCVWQAVEGGDRHAGGKLRRAVSMKTAVEYSERCNIKEDCERLEVVSQSEERS